MFLFQYDIAYILSSIFSKKKGRKKVREREKRMEEEGEGEKDRGRGEKKKKKKMIPLLGPTILAPTTKNYYNQAMV